MINWKSTSLAVALAMLAPSLASAENGLPSQETISAMGLSGMQVMSDQEAMSVRGQGFTFAGGLSWAFVGPGFPNAASVNVSFGVGDYWSSQTNSSFADETIINVTEFTIFPDGTFAATGNGSYTRYRSGGSSAAKAF